MFHQSYALQVAVHQFISPDRIMLHVRRHPYQVPSRPVLDPAVCEIRIVSLDDGNLDVLLAAMGRVMNHSAAMVDEVRRLAEAVEAVGKPSPPLEMPRVVE